jgi:uncharacterized protein
MQALLPDALPLAAALLLVAASFFTSALTAAFGIGGGVALLTIMGYLLPVAALVPMHGAVQLASNAGRMHVQRAFLDWSALIPFVTGAVLGALAGAQLVIRLDNPLLMALLGAFIIAVTWVKLPPLGRASPATFAAGGLATTFATMFFGATGPLTAIFFEKTFPDRRAYSGNHAAAMTAQHGVKVIAFVIAGFAFFEWLPLILAMAAMGYAGTRVGARFLSSLPETRFRLWFRLLITVLALDLMRRGLVAVWWS